MHPHNRFNSLTRFHRMVERDSACMMMQDVCADGTVEKVLVDEPELAVDSGSGATQETPGAGGVVRQGEIGVLEEGYRYFRKVSVNSKSGDVG